MESCQGSDIEVSAASLDAISQQMRSLGHGESLHSAIGSVPDYRQFVPRTLRSGKFKLST